MKLAALIVGLLLISLVISDRITIDKLSQDLVLAQDQISQLNKANTFTNKRNPIKFVKRDNARVKIFGILYEINKDKKKIKYLPGELLVEDHELVQNDQFLDLLDLLFEQEQLIMIEIPNNKTIRENLRVAGFSSDFITNSQDGLFRIKIKE